MLYNHSPGELCDYNVIFIGYYKTFGIFKTYFENSSLELIMDKKTISYVSEESDSVLTFAGTGGIMDQHVDYGLITKFPGPNKNQIVMLAGFGITGTMEMINTLTLPSLLAHLEQNCINKFGYIPEYFECLWEVQGLKRERLTSTIKVLNELDENINYLSHFNY